jgi:O-antigen/teichoic acid export membrane protein
LSGAIVVAAAGFFANVLNLGVSVLIARLLSPSDYGAFSQMVGIFFVVALPGSALSVAVVRRATHYLVAGDEAVISYWQRRLNQRILRWAAGFSLLALGMSFTIAFWLGHRSWLAVWVNTLAALAWAILNVDRALLQARQRYVDLAKNFALEGIARTVGMVALSPFGVTGIVTGLLLAIAVARLHARRLVQPVGQRTGPMLEHTGITGDLLVALATLGLLATLQFLDVFLVGHFDPAGAGPYSAISQVAKTVVYGAIILGNFLLPETAIAERSGSDAYRQLGIAGGLLAIPIVLLGTASEVSAHDLLSLVFGARYAGAYSSLTTLIAAMVFLAGSTLLATYLLGSGRRWPTAWIASTTVFGVWYLASAHGNIDETVRNNFVLQAITFVGLLIATLRPIANQDVHA